MRVLKPGGELHVSVDSLSSIEREDLLQRHKSDHKVIQYFTKASLLETIENAGLKVLEIFPILTSGFAKLEFERRILNGYRHGLVKKYFLYRKFTYEDKMSNNQEGIMLIGRARRPRLIS
jgi:hypothetical protein